MSSTRALVVAGHGSHLNPNSDAPTFAHADRIRDRNVFSEVRAAFWKEEPSLRDVLDTLSSDEAVVVPLFVSEGYFTDEVLPRELGVAERANVRYADPVGTHASMPDVVLDRARSVAGGGIPDDTGLAVVGHGTERNPRSAEAIRDCAGAIRDRGVFSEVRSVFMDQEPLVGTVPELFDGDVVVVPMFVADGFHTREEIPELLGLTDEPGGDFDVPGTVDGARIWYSGAVGTEPSLADVIVERGLEAWGDDATDRVPPAPLRDAAREFLAWIDDAGSRRWGELLLSAGEDREGYGLRHSDDADADPADLDALATPEEVRETVKFDDGGRYRPLSGAPTLPTGWRADGLGARELVRAVDHVYPAGVDHWAAERAGDLDATHYAGTAARQTGIYADVGDLDGHALDRAAEAVCGDCVRRREWEAAPGEPLDAGSGDGAIPCREACSLFVSAARTFLRFERGDEPPTAAEGSARPGEFSDPANRYRRRYLRARAGETTDTKHAAERTAAERTITEP